MKVYYSINILLFYMNKKLDYRNYQTLSEYWKDAQGSVPLPLMHGIRKIQNKHMLNFQSAYKYLLEKGAIIEIK